MMYVYEELGIPVHRRVRVPIYPAAGSSKGFYGILSDSAENIRKIMRFLQLLDGTMDDAAVKEKEERLKRSGYDERMAVISLLLGAVHTALARYAAGERETKALYEEARRLKNGLDVQEPEEAARMLDHEMEKRQRALEIKKEAGLYGRRSVSCPVCDRLGKALSV